MNFFKSHKSTQVKGINLGLPPAIRAAGQSTECRRFLGDSNPIQARKHEQAPRLPQASEIEAFIATYNLTARTIQWPYIASQLALKLCTSRKCPRWSITKLL